MKKFIRAIIPPDGHGWESIFFSVLTAVGIYLFRSQWNGLPPLGMAVGFILILVAPLCCFPISFIAYHVLIAFRYRTKHWTPFVFLIGSTFLAMIYPTPPTFEEEIFVQHRADYEYLVELARSNQLPHNDECKNVFTPPPGYERLAVDCIWISTDPGFNVEFTPRSFYRPLVFFDDPTTIEFSVGACHEDGGVRKQLDEHWFICNRDAN
jgi:hypothetical protein